MRISPALLLLMLIILVFEPAIQDWATQGGSAWYRPHLLWLTVILFVAWSVRRSLRRREQAGGESGERH